jgi:hypothetical protein
VASATAMEFANRSERNDRTGCPQSRCRDEWDGFAKISGCTEDADDDGRRFGRSRQAGPETRTDVRTQNKKSKIEAKLERSRTMPEKDLRQ